MIYVVRRFVLLFCLSVSVSLQASIGTDWLAVQKNIDGSYGQTTDISTTFQSTTETLRTFLGTDSVPASGISDTLDFVDGEWSADTEFLSRKIIVKAKVQADIVPLVDELASRWDARSGGFSGFKNHQPSVYATAFALEALAVSGHGSNPTVSGAIGYIVSQQASVGSWSEGSVYETALSLLALSYYRANYNLDVPITAAQNYLFSRILDNGTWGETFVTATVMSALLRVAADVSALGNTATALTALQLANGSWENDAYVTALAERALFSYNARQPTTMEDNGTLGGFVTRAVTGEAISGAVVTLLEIPGTALNTNNEGYFRFPSLPAGRYTVSAKADGFTAGSVVVDVTAADFSATQNIVLAYANNSGLVQGQVFDQADRSFLAGVRLSLAGAVNYTVTSDASGNFEFSSVVPGSYTLSVFQNGYYAVTTAVEIAAGLLIYNQGLLKEGAFLDSQPADISATIINGDDGQPLAGATLDLGDGFAATSGADGRLTIGAVPRGTYLATLSLAGFERRVYAIQFSAGNDGAMGSLSLYAIKNLAAASRVNLMGAVVDGVTGLPVSGATITVITENLHATSDAAGAFDIPNIGILDFDVNISAQGYQTANYQISVGGFGDANVEIKISPVGDGSTTSTLTGVVSDIDSGLALAGAKVAIPGAGLITTTGVDGSYVLPEIDLLAFTVVVSSARYGDVTRDIVLAAHGNYRLDTALKPFAANTSLKIVSVISDGPSWMGNSTATFSASIANLSSELQTVVVTGEVFNAVGERVSQLTAHESGESLQRSEHSFLPSERKSFGFSWQTGQFPAGVYSLLVRISEPHTASQAMPFGVVISEYILSGVQVTGLSEVAGAIAVDPPLSQAGATTPVSLQALLRNNGNVVLNGQIYQMDILDASQTVLHTVQVNAPEIPVSGIHTADFGSWIPTSSGNLQIKVRAMDASVKGELAGELYVGNKANGSFVVDKTVVSEGTRLVRGSIDLQGVDAATGSSTDPLFVLVRDAVKSGGAYVSSEVRNWQNQNRCLGCHVQSQSLMGLASSVDKADIDPEAVKFTYNTVASSQNSNGVLANAYTARYPRTQTLLGFWSLAAWPDKQQSYLTQYRAASVLHSWRIRSANRIYWRNDHPASTPSQWWYNDIATTAITAIGISDVLTSSASIDMSAVHEYSLTGIHDLGAGAEVRNTTFGPNGSLYVLKENGQINRIDMNSGNVDVVATGLGTGVRGIDVGLDGSIFISAYGHVSKINVDGSIERLYSLAAWFTDVALSANGDLYVSDNTNNKIIVISPSGVINEVAGNNGLSGPVGLGFDKAGNLLIANRDGFNILRLNDDLTLSTLVDGLSFKPLYFDVATDDTIYATTASYSFYGTVPLGMVKIAPDGIAERILQGPAVRSVSIDVAGDVWISNESTNQLDRLTTSVLQPTLLPDLRSDLAGAANYLLYGYANTDPYNVPHAMRMLGLAAARPHITDAAILSSIDQALQYGDDLIRARQNTDGGWGRNVGNISDPLITAMMGLALDELDPSADDPQVRAAIEYLLSQQGGDGSWFNVNNALNTRLSATSFVMAYMPKALERLGGIDVDLYVSARPDVSLSNFTFMPTSSTARADGGVDYYWQLQGVTGSGRSIDFDVQLHSLSLNESRAVATATFIEFNNSFTTEKMREDLDIPEVMARSEMRLALELNKPSYQAGEDINITTLLSNAGVTTSSGNLTLFVRSSGAMQAIAQLPTHGVTTLAGGAQQTLNDFWNSGTILVGDYEIFGQLVDAQGRILDEAVVPFTLVTTGTTAATSVATDKPVYTAWDSVDITARVINTEQNDYLPSTLIEIVVTAPDQSLLFFESRYIGELAPNASRDLSYNFSLSDAPSGIYQVTLMLKDDFSRDYITESSAQFEVQKSAIQGMSGLVTVEFPQIYKSDRNSCTGSITNITSSDVINLELNHQLVNMDLGVVVDETYETLVILAGADTSSYTRTIAANSLAIGNYACILQARVQDNWQPLGYDAFTVTEPLIDIDTTLEAGDGQRLLVLLDAPVACHEEGHDSDEKDSHHHDSDDVHDKAKNDRHSDDDEQEDGHHNCTQADATDPHGPQGAPSLNAQRTWLEERLVEQGVSYTLATDAGAFSRELRSGSYTAYALFSEHIKLSKQTQKELREAVYRGEGLLVAGAHDNHHNKLDDVQGIDTKGKLTAPTAVAIAGPDVYADGSATLPLADRVNRLVPDGAEIVAQYPALPDCEEDDDSHHDGHHKDDGGYHKKKDKKGKKGKDDDDSHHDHRHGGHTACQNDAIAITRHRYGNGRSVTMGFDLLVQAAAGNTVPRLTQLLSEALTDIQPPVGNWLPRAPVHIRLSLNNAGIATSGRAVITLPLDSTVLDAGPAQPQSGGQLTWPFSLAEGESETLNLWLQLPPRAGPAHTEALIQVGIEPAWNDHDTRLLTLTLATTPSLVQVADRLETLKDQDKHYKHALKKVHKARHKLADGHLEKALKESLKAAKELAKISADDAAQIRLLLAQAIRAMARQL